MKARLLVSFFLLVNAFGYSQLEAANWYFGKKAGLNFSSGTPEALFDGMLDTVEGCESFSDSDGNLLFYTDGKTVWNRNHEIMPNGTGLKGSFSTSQSALVVPNPIEGDIYYIFTPDDALTGKNDSESTNGFNYSIVDMSLRAGLGDITVKNEELLPQCSEKVSGVRTSNGDYYWVVTHFRNQFFSYRVDGNGVSTTPVISTVGPMIDDFENIRGNLKISPDGTKLAITHTIVEPEFAGSFYLFDFDVETGMVSNPQLVSDSRVYYGVEFSSNSSKLYASGSQLSGKGGESKLGIMQLVQFDLNETDIQNSEYVVQSFPANQNVFVAGALQIGIDKKIYHSFPNERLSVIRTPNLKGIDIDFRPFSVSLGDRRAAFGLPPFIQSFFETIVTIENFCEGSETTFTTETTGDIASVSWNFGDPDSGVSNVSSTINPSHVFSSFGTFTVTMDVEYTNGSSRRFIEFVEIAERPNLITEVDLVQCDIDGLDDGLTSFNLTEAISLFNNGNPDITALFFLNESDANANINQLDPEEFNNDVNGQQLYARAFENSECSTIVRVNLIAEPVSDLGVYDTVYICDAVQAPLGANIDVTEVYDWLYPYFQDYNRISLYKNREEALFEKEELPLEMFWFGTFDPFPYELYFRVEDGNSCAFIGKVILTISPKPEFEGTIQVNLCNGVATLEALEGYENYYWPDATTNRSFEVDKTGFVDVAFGSGPCLYTQTFEILPEPEIDIQEIHVQDFSRSNSLKVLLGPTEYQENVSFSMDGGVTFQSDNSFKNLDPGIYDLVVDNGCSIFEKEILVGGMPAFFTPNSDGYHDIITMANPTFFPNYKMSIFDRYGKLLAVIDDDQQGWDGTFLNRNMPSDSYWYVLELGNGRTVKGNFTLKR